MTLITAPPRSGTTANGCRAPAAGADADRPRPTSCMTQIVTGPTSRAILAELCGRRPVAALADAQETEIAGRWAKLIRVSFAGELGWEIHSQMPDTPAVFDAVMEAGETTGSSPSACSR